MTVPQNQGYAGPWSLYPGRVADIYVKNQNAVIASTPVIASPPLGCYRMTLALGVFTAGTGGVLTLSGVSTGAFGITVVQSLAGINCSAVGIVQDSFVFEVNAALTALSYQVTASPGFSAGALSYNARVILERLSALS